MSLSLHLGMTLGNPVLQGVGVRADYDLGTPLLIEGFENTTGQVAGNSAILAQDTVNKVQGAAALSIQSIGTSSSMIATKATVATLNPSTFGVVAYPVILESDVDYQTCSTPNYGIGQAGTYQNVAGTTGPTGLSSTTDIYTGVYWHSFNVSENATLAAMGSATTGVRAQYTGRTPYSTTVRADCMMSNSAGRPTIVFTFDDVRPGQYSEALPLFQARGFKGNLFVPSARVGGVDGAGRLTLTQLQEMYAAGWDMACNGTSDDTDMTLQASVAAAVTEAESVQSYLATNGMPRGNDFLCYPNGTYRVNPLAKVDVTTVTSNGTTTVTMASTTGILAGMKVVTSLLAAPGTTVQSVDSGTNLTLAGSVPTGTRPMSFIDTSGAFHPNKLPDALRTAGFKLARTTIPQTIYTRYGFGGRDMQMPGVGVTGLSAAQMIAYVDEAILRGRSMMFYMHDVTVAGASIDVSIANLTTLLDYVKTKWNANVLDVLTLTEWWDRDNATAIPV